MSDKAELPAGLPLGPLPAQTPPRVGGSGVSVAAIAAMAGAEAEKLGVPSPLPKAGRQFKFPDDLFKLQDLVAEGRGDVATLRKVVGVLSESLRSYREEEAPLLARAIAAAEGAAMLLADHCKAASEADSFFRQERNAMIRSLDQIVRDADKERHTFEAAASRLEGAGKRVEAFSQKLDLLDDKIRLGAEASNKALAELSARVTALEKADAARARAVARPPRRG